MRMIMKSSLLTIRFPNFHVRSALIKEKITPPGAVSSTPSNTSYFDPPHASTATRNNNSITYPGTRLYSGYLSLDNYKSRSEERISTTLMRTYLSARSSVSLTNMGTWMTNPEHKLWRKWLTNRTITRPYVYNTWIGYETQFQGGIMGIRPAWPSKEFSRIYRRG